MGESGGAALPEPGTSWHTLRWFIEGSALTDDGSTMALWALDVIADTLGEQWPSQMREAGAPLPGVLWGCATHAGALARLVADALAIARGRDDARFIKPLQALAQAKQMHAWDHFGLQAEVARGAEATSCEFDLDPFAGVKRRRADVLIVGAERTLLVEVTTLNQAQPERDSRAWHQCLAWVVDEVIFNQPVYLDLDVYEAADSDAVAEFTDRLTEAVAAAVSTGRRHEVVTGWCHAAVRYDETGGSEIMGVVESSDAWSRIERKVQDKSTQLTPGPRHRLEGTRRWIRLDVFTGFFSRTDWAMRPDAERLAWISQLLRDRATDDRSHIDGVVISTGRVRDERTDPPPVVETVGDDALLLQTSLGPYAARETIIVATSPGGADDVEWWASVYRTERAAIEEDLRALSLPPLESARLSSASRPT